MCVHVRVQSREGEGKGAREPMSAGGERKAGWPEPRVLRMP